MRLNSSARADGWAEREHDMRMMMNEDTARRDEREVRNVKKVAKDRTCRGEGDYQLMSKVTLVLQVCSPSVL